MSSDYPYYSPDFCDALAALSERFSRLEERLETEGGSAALRDLEDALLDDLLRLLGEDT